MAEVRPNIVFIMTDQFDATWFQSKPLTWNTLLEKVANQR
jgi:hypothetical protein